MSLYQLPSNLPRPVDDGAADHLVGLEVPALRLTSSAGVVDLAEFGSKLEVLYVYPATGVPGRPSPDGWDAIPGARGCTPQSCAFRDHSGALADLGARVAGLSAQPLAAQVEFAQREPYVHLKRSREELRELVLSSKPVDEAAIQRALAPLSETNDP